MQIVTHHVRNRYNACQIKEQNILNPISNEIVEVSNTFRLNRTMYISMLCTGMTCTILPNFRTKYIYVLIVHTRGYVYTYTHSKVGQRGEHVHGGVRVPRTVERGTLGEAF